MIRLLWSIDYCCSDRCRTSTWRAEATPSTGARGTDAVDRARFCGDKDRRGHVGRNLVARPAPNGLACIRSYGSSKECICLGL